MKYIHEVCKISRGASCCRYLVAGKNGITCAKHTELKKTIDHKVAIGQFISAGDNCEGKAEDIDLTKLEDDTTNSTNENHLPLP